MGFAYSIPVSRGFNREFTRGTAEVHASWISVAFTMMVSALIQIILGGSAIEFGVVCWARSCGAPVMGDEHLWWVRDRSCENYSRGGEAIPIMGADRGPC